MAVPNLLLPEWGHVGAQLGDAFVARTERNRLAQLVPGALSGDQNALSQLTAQNPRLGMQVMEQQRYAAAEKAASAKERQALARQDLIDTAGIIVNLPETELPTAWTGIRAGLIQRNPELASRLPEQYDPSVLATARGLAGIKPQNPAGPTSDMQEYELARQQGYGGSFVDYLTGLKKAGASSTTVSYGSPVAGTDEHGNPVYFQPDNKGGPPKILPGVKPAPNKSDQPTQDERQSALLLQRLRRAQSDMAGVLKASPGAARPEISGSIAGAVAGDTARNFANSEERQRIEAAQDDALDAALTLATGAAYTKEQLAMQRRSHFPQIGDSPATAAEKNKRFADLVKDAELRAGRATPPSQNTTKAPPAVGTVRNGYVYKGGDPASPSSWAKQ